MARKKSDPTAEIPPEVQATFAKEIKYESDRGAVLICAAKLDRELSLMLKRVFEKNSAYTDKEIKHLLFSPQGILFNYGARIKIAHAFGLINRPYLDALEKIGALRNHFAHEQFAPRLDESEIIEIEAILQKSESFGYRIDPSAAWTKGVKRAVIRLAVTTIWIGARFSLVRKGRINSITRFGHQRTRAKKLQPESQSKALAKAQPDRNQRDSANRDKGGRSPKQANKAKREPRPK